MNYPEKLSRSAWQKKRNSILERDNYTCQRCNDLPKQKEVHHKDYVGKWPEDTPAEMLVTLCSDCHEEIEAMKKQPDLEVMERELQKAKDKLNKPGLSAKNRKVTEQAILIIQSEIQRIYGRG